MLPVLIFSDEVCLFWLFCGLFGCLLVVLVGFGWLVLVLVGLRDSFRICFCL